MARASGEPTYFAAPAEFRAWLEAHHDTAVELWVGYYKKATGRPSLSWPESVDEALCFGWIDGIRKRVDAERYAIRFTPRKPASHWSAVNVRRLAVLEREGRLHPAGRAAFGRRREDASGVYSYEQRKTAAFDGASLRRFRQHRDAWAWFGTQPPSYRQTVVRWVMSAKRPETRLRRLDTLIDDSAHGRRIGPLRR